MEAFEVCYSPERHVGRVVIISMEEKAEPERKGGDKDRHNLVTYFTSINFEVIQLIDETETVIMRTINNIASERVANYDIFMCIVMAHGEVREAARNHFFQVARDKYICVEHLMDRFNNSNCPALYDKPKIFLINTCRGDKDGHANSPTSYQSDAPSTESESRGDRSPSETVAMSSITNLEVLNRIVAYSTMEGYKSWRNEEFGTVFIYSLLRVLRETQFRVNPVEFKEVLQMTNTDIIQLTKVGQAVDYRVQGMQKSIYLQPNTSLEVKQWLRIGLEDGARPDLTDEEIVRQAMRLHACQLTTVRTLLTSGRTKSVFTLIGNGISKPHAAYLHSRIQGTHFVPTVSGCVAALRHISLMASVTKAHLPEDESGRMMRLVMQTILMSCTAQNLPQFATNRDEFRSAVKELLVTYNAAPNVRDLLATTLRSFAEQCMGFYLKGTPELTLSTVLVIDLLAEISHYLLCLGTYDHFQKPSPAVDSHDAAYVRRSLDILLCMPVLPAELCEEYRVQEGVAFLALRETLCIVVVNVMRYYDCHGNPAPHRNIVSLGCRALIRILSTARSEPIRMDVTRTGCLAQLEVVMGNVVRLKDSTEDLILLCVEVIELLKNDKLFLVNVSTEAAMNEVALHQLNFALLTRLLACLGQFSKNGCKDATIQKLFVGMHAVTASKHFNCSDPKNNSPLDITAITTVMSTHAQHMLVLIESVRVMEVFYRFQVQCPDAALLSLLSSVVPLIAYCKNEYGFDASKAHLTSVAYVVFHTLITLRTRKNEAYGAVALQSGLLREVLGMPALLSENSDLLKRFVDILPYCLSVSNITAYVAESLENKTQMRALVTNLLNLVAVRAQAKLYVAPTGFLVGSYYFIIGDQSLVTESYIRTLHQVIAYDNSLQESTEPSVPIAQPCPPNTPVQSTAPIAVPSNPYITKKMLQDKEPLAGLLVQIRDFEGIGLFCSQFAPVEHTVLMRDAGALDVIVEAVQTDLGRETPVVDTRWRDHIAHRWCYLCSAIIPFTKRADLMASLVALDIHKLLIQVVEHLRSEQYWGNPDQIKRIGYCFEAVRCIAESSVEVRGELGNWGMCESVLELLAVYPDSNHIYPMIIALCTDCPINCKRFSSCVNALIEHKIEGEIVRAGSAKSQNIFTRILWPRDNINKSLDYYGVLLFKTLRTLSKGLEENREKMVQKQMFVHIVFCLEQIISDKVRAETRAPLVAEILTFMHSLFKTVESITALARVDKCGADYPAMIIIASMRLCCAELDRQLIRDTCCVLHHMVIEAKCYRRANAVEMKEGLSDLQQHLVKTGAVSENLLLKFKEMAERLRNHMKKKSLF